MITQLAGKIRERFPIADGHDSGWPMYSPKGRLLAWLRKSFNSSPGKWSIRYKQRDPVNYGNGSDDPNLHDTEILVAESIHELLEMLLLKANHMQSGIMYCNTPEGDVIYSRKEASGGFSVDKYVLGLPCPRDGSLLTDEEAEL